MANRKLSPAGADTLKRLEEKGGFPSLKAYLDSAGVWTIGFGHTGPEVVRGMTITTAEAEALFRADVAEAEMAVDILVNVDLTQNEFDALVIFTFNVGVTALKNSTLLRLLNQGKKELVPEQMKLWVHVTTEERGAGGKKMKVKRVSKGLQNRRAAEVIMWNEPAATAVPRETFPIVQPQAIEVPDVAYDNVVPDEPPARKGGLSTSTGKAQAVAGVAGGTAAAIEVVDKASEASDTGSLLTGAIAHLQGISFVQSVQFMLVVATLALIGWTFWDRRRKAREEGR